ncbi:MAG: CoA transferase [Limnobacter sp.]|nr:CoA transferase [Limnobacter sp.]
MSESPTSGSALAGVRVVDLSRLVSGNIATHVLADLGADVIKVEPLPRGDDLRNWRTAGVSTYWKVYSRNKRSLALDLRQPAAMQVLRRLIATAQVLVENFRPGTLEKMGLAPDALLAAHPWLVVLRISGWGQTGPYADRGGFGSLVEALCGFAAMNGYDDRPPVLPPFALADSMAGLYGAIAALNAVRHAERTGVGQVVDLSLFDPIHSLIGPLALEHQLTGRSPRRAGSRSPTHAPRNVYETSDGRFIALSAGMEGTVQRLFAAIGRPDMVGDPRFSSHAARIEHIDELDAVIGDFVRARTMAENLAFFAAQDVTAGEICDAGQLAGHPYAIGRGVVVEQPDDELGSIRTPAPPLRFAGTPAMIRTQAPALGEHSRELLAELGYLDAEIASMQAAGQVRCADAAARCAQGLR